MKKKRSLVCYIIITFVLSVLVCFLLEVFAANITPSAIMENSQKSALYYRLSGVQPQTFNDWIYTRKCYDGDAILINLMYQQESEHPVKSVILSPYYDEASMDATVDCMASTFGEVDANTYYFRYWHGSIVWLKPLLCIMDITGIYRLYGVIIIGFTLVFLIWSLIKKKFREGISYFLAFIIIGGWVTISCLEYANIMLLLMGMVPLFLRYGKKGEKELLGLCVIDGVLTCFVDFLTVETITITVPLCMMILCGNTNLKSGTMEKTKSRQEFITTLKALFCWGISYAGMFLVKWILAATIIGVDGMKDSFMRTGEHMAGYRLKAFYYNILMLFPWKQDASTWIQTGSVRFYVILMILIICLLWKKKRMSMMILFLIPYLRYGIVGSHSYMHYYYTYRAQMISVLIIVYVLWGLIIERKRRKMQGI